MVPATLPVTCPKHIIFNGNTCPRYCRLSACSTGRDELSSTFQAIPVLQADKKLNGNTHPRYRRSTAGNLLNMLITTWLLTANKMRARWRHLSATISFIFKWWTWKKKSSSSATRFDRLHPKLYMHISFCKKYKAICSDQHTEIKNY